MSDLLDIADAVVTQLNAETWSPTFTATRAYIIENQLTALDDLVVTVIPSEQTRVNVSRSGEQHDHVVMLGIQQRPTTISNAVLDPLVDLAEAIANYFENERKLTAYPTASCTLVENTPPYQPQRLRENREFLTIITLTYSVQKT